MIQVIHRALDILEFIAEEPEKQKSLSEISEKLDLNSGTCANIIKTLVSRNYINKIDKRKGYCLGARAYTLAEKGGYKKNLAEAAREELNSLTAKLNENSLLSILDDDIRRVIVRVLSPHAIQANTASEKRAYDSSTGRLLIAMLPDPELDKFIKRFGLPLPGEWEEVTDEKTLLEVVRKIRTDGYAIQLTKSKIIGLAVPVLQEGKVIAGLSVYMPQFRYAKSDKKEIIAKLMKSSRNITRKLQKGYKS